MGRGLCYCFDRPQPCLYFKANLNLPSDLWKVGQGQRLCNCTYKLSNFGGLPTGRGDGWKGGCVIVLIDLNPAYIIKQI